MTNPSLAIYLFSGPCTTKEGEACQFPFRAQDGTLSFLCTRDVPPDVAEDRFDSFCPTKVDRRSLRVSETHHFVIDCLPH